MKKDKQKKSKRQRRKEAIELDQLNVKSKMELTSCVLRSNQLLDAKVYELNQKKNRLRDGLPVISPFEYL